MTQPLTKQEFKNLIQSLFQIYPHFKNEKQLTQALENLDLQFFETQIKTNNYNAIFFELNKNLTIQIVIEKLFEIEANISLQSLAIEGLDDSYYDVKDAFKNTNTTNQNILKELFTILESKKLVMKK